MCYFTRFSFFSIVLILISNIIPQEAEAKWVKRCYGKPYSPYPKCRWTYYPEHEGRRLIARECCPGEDEKEMSLLVGGELVAQSNMGFFPQPSVFGSIEWCMNYFPGVNGAPSKFGLDLAFGQDVFRDTYMMYWGLGMRYQWPVTENVDWGLYWKLKVFNAVGENTSKDHLTGLFGTNFEIRPFYDASANRKGSNDFFGQLFVPVRVLIGRDAYGHHQRIAQFIWEVSAGLGIRMRGDY